MSGNKALEKRLDQYWKLEAANVLLVPIGTAFLAYGNIGWLTGFTFIPVCLLLAIGAYYWRAKLRYIRHREPLVSPVIKIGKWQLPSLFLTVAGIGVAIAGWTLDGSSIGRADQIAATAMAVLAVLEYVNYYHRQLQHFDHAADWKRLTRGGGFRKSQLRSDLERFGLR